MDHVRNPPCCFFEHDPRNLSDSPEICQIPPEKRRTTPRNGRLPRNLSDGLSPEPYCTGVCGSLKTRLQTGFTNRDRCIYKEKSPRPVDNFHAGESTAPKRLPPLLDPTRAGFARSPISGRSKLPARQAAPEAKTEPQPHIVAPMGPTGASRLLTKNQSSTTGQRMSGSTPGLRPG